MSLLADLRFGTRVLLKRPGTTALAVVALALGIGLTTTMFSIVQGAFLRGLPFPESERIYHLGRVRLQSTGNAGSLPPHDFADWVASQRVFEELGAFTQWSVNVTGGLAPERYRASRVSTNMLRILRIAPAAGRDFTDADAQPGAPPVVIVSDRVWATQFERDPAIAGKLVRVNGVPTTIVGVMPPKFGFPQTADIWAPLPVALPVKRGDGNWVQAFGRLKHGVPEDAAATEMTAIAARLAATHPENKDQTARITPYIRRMIGNEPIQTLTAMLGAVFGVMLIACANVANLQLARAAERVKEIAVRTALGAGRGRIIRQLLLEGFLLSAAGTGIGLVIAVIGTGLFNRAIVDSNPPFWIDIRVDGTVLLVAALLAIVAAIAASLVPALRVTRQDVHGVLKDEGRANTGLRMGRMGRVLVVAEVLLSCTLLIVSGLMIKSVIKTGSITYPYDAERVFVAGAPLDETKYKQPADRARATERIEAAIRGVAGVGEVALANGTPENVNGQPFSLEGKAYARPEDRPSARTLSVSPAFFATLRVTLVQGRAFTAGDITGSQPVAIVSDDFVKKHFPDGRAVDKRIQLGGNPEAPWRTIVGVAPRLVSSRETGEVEMVFTPLAQSPTSGLMILASTSGDPRALATPVRRALQTVDEDLPLSQPNSLARSYWQRTWAVRVFGTLFMAFGVAALTLSAAGLYGVMAFSVRRRTQEIGVRMALGADRRGVVHMVLWQGMWRVLLGIALGLAPAWALAGLMRGLLFNVTQLDTTVYVLTVVCLLATGFVASVVPALRAASVDPLRALRHD
jgi:predicted permease